MKEFDFVRVGAIVPKLSLANPLKNALEIVEQVTKAYKKGVAIVTTPELSLTGYTCGDLFLQDALLNEAEEAPRKTSRRNKRTKYYHYFRNAYSS